MEQRLYKGNITVNGLADYLVQHYEAQRRMQVQKLGQEDHLLVQIGQGRNEERVQGAITVGIAPAPDTGGIVVTMGQQRWLDPNMGGHVAGTLIGALFTPWALFGMLWPLSHMAESIGLPQDIWNTIELYCTSAGATLAETAQMSGIPCPYCGMMNEVGATTCVTCGKALPTATAPGSAEPVAAQTAPGGGGQSWTASTGPTARLDAGTCAECGAAIPAGARFCNQCGARVPDTNAAV